MGYAVDIQVGQHESEQILLTCLATAAQRSPVLMHRLDNVSNIIIHFTAKVDEWYVVL